MVWHDLLYPGDATDFFKRVPMPPFDRNASGYSADNARWLMELSRLVYRHDKEESQPPPQPTRDSFLAGAGFKLTGFFQFESDDIDIQAMLVESLAQPPFAVLVFRGTEQNSGDLKTDIKVWKNFIETLKAAFLPPNGKEIRVHAGFEQALNPVWGAIAAELGKLQYPVFYTGHSLGAALATLAALRHPPKAVYTFGSPRVGNQAFADSLAGISIYRVIDDRDVVATVPPEKFMGKDTGFMHVGEEHRLTAPGYPFIDWIKNLFGPPKWLADHAPVNYVDRIK